MVKFVRHTEKYLFSKATVEHIFIKYNVNGCSGAIPIHKIDNMFTVYQLDGSIIRCEKLAPIYRMKGYIVERDLDFLNDLE